MGRYRPLLVLSALVLIGAACTKPATNAGNSENPRNDSVLTTNTSQANSRNDAANANSTAVLRTAIVRLTPDGVSEKNLGVLPGTVVSFVNDDVVGHWIASDPHPAHTGLPGFDARGAIAPGSSYEFTFITTGTFGYHDHLDAFNANFRGTITVTP